MSDEPLLGLHHRTPPDWAAQALADPARLLLDHYFCECKAAATARLLLRRHGGKHPPLAKLMTDLAAEEMGHADQVLRFLKDYPRPAPEKGGNRYAQALRDLCRDPEGENFLDLLIVCSLIEARSAERFRLLADCAHGSTLGRFYADLYAAEVNHFVLFVKLAHEIHGGERAEQRLREMRQAEARIVLALPWGSRVH